MSSNQQCPARHPRLVPHALCLAIGALAAGAAHAQAAEAGTSAEKAKLDAVVVSGQGRVQQLQNVPIPIQVLGPDQLKKSGAANLGDIAATVPGLAMDTTQATQPSISLRGVGTLDFGIGTDSPVGLYVDGVYAGKTGGALLNFNDVKRIEVLKGPQGTLFGRNSAGGAISIVTNEPEFERKGSALVRLGERGQRDVQLLVNEPIHADLALRATLVSQRSDGFTRDAGTGERFGGDHSWGLRASLLWQGEAARAVLSLEQETLHQNARPAIGVVPLQTGTPPFPANPAAYANPLSTAWRNDVADQGESRDYQGATLRLSWPLAGWLQGAELQSTTAWRHFNSRNRQDNDGTANPALFLATTNREGNTSWQQEFRLSGKNALVDWMGGVSFYREQARQGADADSTTTALDTLSGNVLGMPLFSTVNGLIDAVGIPGMDLRGQSWHEQMDNRGTFSAMAVYGDLIWTLSPATRLTTGLRLTQDRKTFSWSNPLRSAPGLDAQLSALDGAGFFPGLVAAGALTADEAAQLQGAMAGNVLIATSGATAAPVERRQRWHDASPRLVLDHRVSPDLMVYGSWSKGYQAGGFNSLQVNSLYEPEHVRNLEVGAKGRWADVGLSYAASLFQYRFDNLQTLQLVPNAGGGIPAYQVTISDQQAKGADVDLRWQPDRHWQVFANVQWLDQTYRRGTSSQGHALDGQPAGAPKVQASGGVEYGWNTAGGLASLRLQWSHQSATRCSEESYVQGLCFQGQGWRVGGSRQRLDGRVAWEASDGRWGLALVGRNLLDKREVQRVWYEATPLGAAYATLAKPRSIAFEARVSY
ncbi:TonB-dependent receptor [Pelomonas sp. APW6]|uniref:TonB-dependent receptor n=1 Tax=Roseateles subflavus TaxID=3053353 RepID=A0ABT7LFG7_9BURK|nr:TonB-dependent receptor [Pelomonas sp. APW6]MDL5031595.1 TonB-dependent receptor [Pelomonas sp. APW6]